jgi:alpha-tubulin suppressor-like RCC1 family protein
MRHLPCIVRASWSACPSRPRLASFIFPVLLAALACRDTAPDLTDPDVAPSAAAAAAAVSYTQLAASLHGCGVTADFRTYCWGYNVHGEVGDGTTADQWTPVRVAADHQFRQISTNFYHTCALDTADRAWCWGGNFNWMLGDGTNTERHAPVPVAGGLQFRQVAAGIGHSCGVTTDNRAWCWGGNDYGELGDGTTTFRTTPVRVAGTLRFRSVRPNGYFTCGITTTDEVYCWGNNRDGQVGDGSTALLRRRPVKVAGARTYRDVTTGYGHACAVTAASVAWCWGTGDQGQLGIGVFGGRRTPTRVKGSGSVIYTRLSGGFSHTCAEAADNTAWCWGEGEALGRGSEEPSAVPVPVSGGLKFAQVSAGGSSNCGRTSAGVGYCWGSNIYGRLGDGTTVDRLTPVPIADPR